MGSGVSRVACALSALVALGLAIPAAASATDYLVGPYLYPEGSVYDDGHTCDPTPSGFECTTIRAAVIASDAKGGSNRILLGNGALQLTIPPSGADDVTTGDLNITTDTTIQGAGASASVIEANGVDRLFEVATGVSLTINGVMLMDGKTSSASQPDQSGGAIEAVGTGAVTLVNSSVTSSTASGNGNGGAIASASGPLSLTGSLIESNQAGGSGGGIFTNNATALVVNSSTLDKNQAALDGGGISATSAVAPAIANSTIVGNIAGGNGGGVDAHVGSGVMTIDNATVVQNTASGGSGGNMRAVGLGAISVENSIVGGGQAMGSANNCSFGAAGIDAGHNLFFDLPYTATSTDNCFAAPGPSDIPAASGSLAQGPGLASSGGTFAVAYNGGLTPTVALLAGSPALNTANPLGCATSFPGAGGVDQRGVARLPALLVSCDIGAFEPEAFIGLSGSVTPTSGQVGQPLTFSFHLINNGPDAASGVRLSSGLPGGALDSTLSTQGSCGFFGGLSCDLGVVPNKREAAVSITVTPAAPGTYSMTGTARDDQSGATAPLTLSAPVTGSALAGGGSAAAASAAAGGTKSGKAAASKKGPNCASLRKFKIHVQHVAQFHLVSAKIFIGGRLRASLKAPNMSATINLKKRPQGTFRLRIVAVERNGHVLVGTRAYHTCRSKLNGHSYLLL